MKECAHILPALHRLAEGELNAREAGKVIEHCRTCPECSEVLKDFRYMQGLLKKGLAKELSIPDFVGNVRLPFPVAPALFFAY
jgi:anti-sigma factor RsiW